MKKWADLKCDGKRRIAALRGPNGSNMRKKKMGPVEKMVHKILMLSPETGEGLMGGGGGAHGGEEQELMGGRRSINLSLSQIPSMTKIWKRTTTWQNSRPPPQEATSPT